MRPPRGRRRARAVAAGALLAAVVAGGVLAYRQPYHAADGLRAALRAGDAVAIAARTDLDAVREGLKRQLLAHFVSAAPDDRTALAASRFVGALVDDLVTPAALARLGQGGEAAPTRRGWRGPSTFEEEVTGEAGVSVWRFERRGLGFSLVHLELPASVGAELKRQWSARVAAAQPTASDVAALEENEARACAAWRRNALALLQAYTRAQRAHHAAQGRFAASLESLPTPPRTGPDLYELVVTRGDDAGFSLEARGKGLMAGDRLVADLEGIRVLDDRCAR